MKHFFYILIGIVLAITTLSSCEDDAYDSTTITEQSLLVYMPWSGSESSQGLYGYFLENLDSINKAIIKNKGLGQNKLFVFLSNSATASQLYEVTYQNGTTVKNLIKEYTGTDYNTSAGITEILNQMVEASDYSVDKDIYRTLNYAMLVGCHGSGWTYKDDWQNYPSYAKALMAKSMWPTTENGSKKIPTRFFGSTADKNYGIDIETLAEGIRNAKTGKLQYIAFDDCYMANVETAYELKGVTNFLIASPSEIDSKGFAYSTMWNNLSSKAPNYSNLVTSFKNYYLKLKVDYKTFGTLSAINCNEVDSIASIMRDINAKYTLADSLRDSVQISDGFYPNIFFDMKSYVNNLNLSQQLKGRFNDQFSKLVPYTATVRDSIYTALTPNGDYIKLNGKYSGITISDISTHPVAEKGKKKTGWWKATHEAVEQKNN